MFKKNNNVDIQIETEQEFKEKFTKERALEELKKRFGKAKALLDDDQKMERFLQRLENKLKIVPIIGNKLAVVPILASLLKNYFRKEYQDAPVGTMIAVTAALIYFVSPIDFVPDFIIGLGYLDDAAVVALCMKLIDDDVKEYLVWREQYYKEREL